MGRVVKCNGCGQYFMHTVQDKKCPFCRNKYREVEEKTSAQGGFASDGKDKKGMAKTVKKYLNI